MSPRTYPGRVHGRINGQPATLCGLATSAALAIVVLGQTANPAAITCQACRKAIK